MAESIRAYVRRRQRLSEWFFWVGSGLALVSLVLIVPGVRSAMRGVFTPQPFPYLWLSGAGFVLFLAAMAVMMRLKCPRCGKRLQEGPMIRSNYCAQCGVNFDELISQRVASGRVVQVTAKDFPFALGHYRGWVCSACQQPLAVISTADSIVAPQDLFCGNCLKVD